MSRADDPVILAGSGLGVGGTGGFNPNEDPVLIGARASIDDGASGTATPSHPNVGQYTSNVVIGADALADGPTILGNTIVGSQALGTGLNVTALGQSTQAVGDESLAAGYNAVTVTADDVALGPNASADGNSEGAVALGWFATAAGGAAVALGSAAQATGEAVAVGPGSQAGDGATAVGWAAVAASQPSSAATALGAGAAAHNPEYGVALGYLAVIDLASDRSTAVGGRAHCSGQGDGTALGYAASDGGFTGSTAVGSGAVATRDFQVMLGDVTAGVFAETFLGYALTDTDGSGNRWILQVNGGVLTITPAP